jgi:hypothetical protein
MGLIFSRRSLTPPTPTYRMMTQSVGRWIATADVATFQAEASVNPIAADLETLLTTIRSARLDLQYLIQMRPGCFHVCPPLSGLLNNGEQR